MNIQKVYKSVELLPNLWLLEHNLSPITKLDRRSLVEDFLLDFAEPIFLEHTINGEPQIKNSDQTSISISYCENYCVVYFGMRRKVGVDIQECDPRISKARSIFLKPAELALVHYNQMLSSAAWCVKEATFKRFGGELNSLLHDFTILELNENSALVHTKRGDIQLKLMKYKHCIIAITVD